MFLYGLARFNVNVDVGLRVLFRGGFVFVLWQSNDLEFSKQLAALCDYYVNDAFGTAHRAHASTEGITKFVERKVGVLSVLLRCWLCARPVNN